MLNGNELDLLDEYIRQCVQQSKYRLIQSLLLYRECKVKLVLEYAGIQYVRDVMWTDPELLYSRDPYGLILAKVKQALNQINPSDSWELIPKE